MLRLMVHIASVLGLLRPAAAAAAPEVGRPAPGFEMRDQYMKNHSLEQYRGKWVVVYFYPINGTPGCTAEACYFRNGIFKLRVLNAEVLGISLDSAERYSLPFPLLSDAAGEVAGQYGCLIAWQGAKIAARHTFIIDPKGCIAKIYRKVNALSHSEQVAADLASLQAG